MNYDVIVVGFGTAGACAATAAAREGARVLVLEKNTYPGGTYTGGFVHGFYYQQPVGLLAECFDTSGYEGFGGRIEGIKHNLETAALAAGADIRYEVTLFEVLMERDRVTGIGWREGNELHRATAATVIDATAEAVVCRLAGCELQYGRASDRLCNPFTNSFAVHTGAEPYIFNFDAGRINQYDAEDFSRMMLTSTLDHLCGDFQAAERDRLAPSDLPGIREGARIVIDKPFTLLDFLNGDADVSEPVFYVYSNLDTHSDDMPLENEVFQDWMIGDSMWGTGIFFPVPRRCLFPKRVKGLLAAGRHLGVDHDLGYAIRMNAGMGAVGEAAGILAAMAARQGCLPDEVSYGELAAKLLLPPSPLAENDKIWGLDLAEIKAGLASDQPGFAAWSARKRKCNADLKLWMSEAEAGSNLRRHSAFALALLGDAAALPELRQTVLERDPYVPATSRKSNHQRGYAAVYLLGKLWDAEAIDLLNKVLQEDTITPRYEYHSNALLALLKIGEAHPEFRSRAGVQLRRFVDSDWALEYRLKATETWRRIDAVFRAYIKEKMSAW